MECLLLLLGASGSGKSSLVRAGVLPHLRRLPERWQLLPPMRPGQDPVRELALRLATVLRQDLEAQQNESQALASLAENEVERGSAATAVRLALAALPRRLDSPDRAYAPQAEGALLHGVQHLRERQKFFHNSRVSSVAFSPDGRLLATGSWDNTVRLWEVATGTEIATLRGAGSVGSVAFSPDGRLLATGSWDNTVRLLEAASGTEINVLRGHEAEVFSVAFSPDGRLLATAGSYDKTVPLWPLEPRVIDLACARVHFLPLSERDKQRFGIKEEWCTQEMSAALRAELRLDEAQNNLGSTLKSDTRRLEEAIDAYRAALQERTRERAPLQWAMTQNNLGIVLANLGERESGTARLEEAVEAYRAALQERTRERAPLYWAATQLNLGNALLRLGERESGTARLEEAVASFSRVLQVKR